MADEPEPAMGTLRKGTGRIVAAVLVLALSGCERDGRVASPESAARLADSSDGADWAGYGRTDGQQHFSPLRDIATGTVDRLGLAWSLDLPPVNTVTEPIAVDGVIYLATGLSVVRAIDAASGRQLWEYDPEVGAVAGKHMRAGWGVRGLAWWNGKVFVGTQDGRLIAIAAASGKPVWTTRAFDQGTAAYVSGAPRVFGGRVLIGFGGTVGAVRGHVTAFDAESGRQLWRFWTVPGDPAKGFENKAMAMAAKTWNGEWWKFGGGATVWNSMAWDAETDTVYIGTGSPYPWNHRVRSQGKGDNLFAASIVALDGRSGDYRWHYQVNPGDTWDFDATMDMVLADLDIGGRTRKVLMQAPKNGFFYVLDRRTGELISAEPFARTTWASRIDRKTGRPVEVPGARFAAGAQARIAPSSIGAHNWMAMAFDPASGLVYIPAQDFEADYSQLPGPWTPPQDFTFGGAQVILGGPAQGTRKATGHLLAWSPVLQREVWRFAYPTFLNGGVLASAGGLVWQGSLDGILRAFEAATGKIVWQFDAQAPILSAPISFSAGGRQMLAVTTGSGTANAAYAPSMVGPDLSRFLRDPRTQPRRLLVFALDGKASLPPRSPMPPVPADPGYRPDAGLEQAGAMPYLVLCSSCHGEGAVALGNGPDLRWSALLADEGAFAAVVRDGAMTSTGMPAFPEIETPRREAIRHYLRARAASLRAKASPAYERRPAGFSGGL